MAFLHDSKCWRAGEFQRRGSFSNVYYYTHITTDSRVAAKLVKFDPNCKDARSSMKALKNEIKRLSMLSHE